MVREVMPGLSKTVLRRHAVVLGLMNSRTSISELESLRRPAGRLRLPGARSPLNYRPR
jgi:hypothetical protein